MPDPVSDLLRSGSKIKVKKECLTPYHIKVKKECLTPYHNA